MRPFCVNSYRQTFNALRTFDDFKDVMHCNLTNFTLLFKLFIYHMPDAQ